MAKRDHRFVVLKYSATKQAQSTVRRYYLKWRNSQNLPIRCDNVECRFYVDPLVWNGKPLKLILDHVDGNRFDNRPQKLRLLCPNCDSQLPTRGGGNRGRIRAYEGGFSIRSDSGKTNYSLIADTGRFSFNGPIEISSSDVDNPTLVAGGLFAFDGKTWDVPFSFDLSTSSLTLEQESEVEENSPSD